MTSEWQPPPMYAHNPRVVALLHRVRNWQADEGMQPDGLIGPNTWRRRDARLEGLAWALFAEMDGDKRVQAQLYRFLRTVLRKDV